MMFTTPLEKKLLRAYRRIFSIAEIETQPILQWVFGATILSYFLAFHAWIDTSATTIDAYARGTHLCWPHFQNCGEWLFLRALPDGYSQTLLYMFLFGTLALAIYLMHRKEWVLAHMLLVLSFLWHATVAFFLTYSLAGNYDYYLFLLGFVLLFLPHKEFFLKLVFVLLYFLSTATKIHETWIVGTYFSALKTGLPLFPEWSIPFWTNTVVFMEMIAAWFLLSSNKLLQRTVFTFFVAFHLYSGLLVEYRYPATVLPTLLILFGPFYRFTKVPLDRRAIVGWLLILCMFAGQSAAHLIPGDEKLTMEGNKLGLYMFEANHQCISTTHVEYKNGSTRTFRDESASARARCDPYRYWFRLQAVCTSNEIRSIAWSLDHSVNGGPFLRIVDESNACTLSYSPFSHNAWIRTEKDNPSVIGYPVENIYE